MLHDPRLSDEPGRMAALNRCRVLDTQPEEQFEKITALVRSVFDVPIAAVSLVDDDRQWFKSMQGLDCTETPRDVAFCDYTIRTREPLTVGDAHEDPRFRNNALVVEGPMIRAYMGAPLQMSDGYNIGALCAIDRRPRTFTQAEERMLTAFAALVVDELELRLIADEDALTGVMTRRAFLQRVERESNGQGQGAGTFAMVDLDHFKSINDRFGHPAGDQVLKQAAAACRECLQPGDVIGRLGGEEFGILFAGSNLQKAKARAEDIRAAIAALTFDFDAELQITASFGLAALDRNGTEAVIGLADTALYMAKRQGRNCCIAIDPVQAAA